MIFRAIPYLALTCALFLYPFNAFCTEGNKDVVRAQEDLDRLKGQITDKKESVREVSKKERSVFDEFEKIGKELAQARAQERDIERRQRQVASEIKKLSDYLVEAKDALTLKEDAVGARIKAMYKHGRAGYHRSLFASESYSAAVRQQHYLSLVAAEDRYLFDDFHRMSQDAQARRNDLMLQQEELAAIRKESEQKGIEVARRLAEKKGMLESIRKEKAVYENVLKGLEDSSLQIQAMLKEISRKQASQKVAAASSPAPAITSPAPVVTAPPAAPVAPPPAPPAATPSPLTAPSALPRDVTRAETRPQAFAEMKGRLPWPASGAVIGRFGRYEDTERKIEGVRRGIEIGAPEGSDIAAVFPGKVIYANWLKGYGKTVILDHGATFYTVYAHISDILVREGDRVGEGEILGRVGDTGSLRGPDLYFEVRNGGDPEDPQLWLKRR